ncbi:NAD(P)H-hydrate dehydratase [Streptococcus dysgalactiae]|uniref:ADP-dependent (S)-NAD(P)H-hydrate dehydratase n=1 Tax=Streptococcus dysgalactiae TaxID=1334 RepID=A0AAE9UND2_STRDY|nr:NAD(P)H-hydrate dehydratase [Streptococcus dysgalactiae]QGH04530.1 NAD(P)H-hydrate dehydratase [Streptococcus dysgalactiae subsp. dysgalactiae]WAI93640.1 NAD(P)H-hydrate dehydratase [Streptococcus dysgalactiae]WCE86846.1 NAD(P)H-hydrate dehydratase [Streptococcus dysgalactiae]WCN26843.1 NAD(P)H-hydrate dehydratase [Streptococcus dysgalactiae]BBE39793.1 ADP-dependent (S)-NAD(P)H-hydrate dehydratase [Streptococcus dysgalactiae]
MISDHDLARKVILPRQKETHKGSYGRLLLIGGLAPYGGAIIMAALAALNSGAGLITVATDQSNISALHSHLPEAMAFSVDDRDLLLRQLEVADLVLIGPGLSENSKAQRLFEWVVSHIKGHQLLLVDGSALTIAAQKNYFFQDLTSSIILTPHQKEWERLSGLAIDQQTVTNIQKALQQFPQGTILVAKSSATKLYQDDKIYELTVGGPYQATGGMGDTLVGMIAAMAVQFKQVDLFDRVACAAYLHSAIADALAQEAYVVLPTAISQEIPKWMKVLSEENE